MRCCLQWVHFEAAKRNISVLRKLGEVTDWASILMRSYLLAPLPAILGLPAWPT